MRCAPWPRHADRSQDSIFSSYHVESNSGNEIYLDVLTAALLQSVQSRTANVLTRHRALKSCPGASGVIVKLVRRDKAPALAFIVSHSVR